METTWTITLAEGKYEMWLDNDTRKLSANSEEQLHRQFQADSISDEHFHDALKQLRETGTATITSPKPGKFFAGRGPF